MQTHKYLHINDAAQFLHRFFSYLLVHVGVAEWNSIKPCLLHLSCPEDDNNDENNSLRVYQTILSPIDWGCTTSGLYSLYSGCTTCLWISPLCDGVTGIYCLYQILLPTRCCWMELTVCSWTPLYIISIFASVLELEATAAIPKPFVWCCII